MRRYYLHTRKGIFYAEIIDQATGRKLPAKSTGQTERDAALLVVARWLDTGIPSGRKRKTRPIGQVFELDALFEAIRKTSLDTESAESIVKILKERGLIVGNFVKAGPSAVSFLDFLNNAWDQDKSPFLKERAAYGHALTKRHIIESAGVIKRYWERPTFKGVLLVDITRQMLKDHLMSLHDEGLSAGTLNKALSAISAPLGWASREKTIAENPSAGIPRFTGGEKKRGILTEEEVRALMAYQWPDERARVAFITCLTCGLRLSEVQALQLQDLGIERLFVRHSWSFADGLTCTKNKEARTIPALPEVLAGLRGLVESNPHGIGPEGFVFYGIKPDQPIDAKVMTDGFIEALEGIGIDNDIRKSRGLCFHSLRHSYATAMASRVSESVAASGTGHKDLSMLKHYADHATEENLKKLAEAGADAFGNVLSFKQANG